MTTAKISRWGKAAAFLPAAAWYCLIWSFSGQPASQSGTLSDRLLYSLLEAVSPAFAGADDPVQIAAVEMLSFFERKAAHMFLYFVLALLLCAALCFVARRIRNRVALSALACAVLAGIDEYHQTMVPGRSGEVRDVLVDLCGAGIALGLLVLPCLAAGRRERHRPFPVLPLIPGVACVLPALLAVTGVRAVAASPLLFWTPAQFAPAMEGYSSEALAAALAPALWDAVYLAACGVMGLGALLAALLSGAKLRMTAAVCAAAVAAAALLAAAGTVQPAAAAGLTLLALLGAGAMWGLGTVLFFRQRAGAEDLQVNQLR